MADSERKIITLDDLERRHVLNHQKPYFDWLRHVVTLSLGALTALVALQGHYIPRQPMLKPALVVCWVALLASILLGLIALKEEYLAHLRLATQLRSTRRDLGDAKTAQLVMQGMGEGPSQIHKRASQGTFVAFAVALAALCLFAATNFLLA